MKQVETETKDEIVKSELGMSDSSLEQNLYILSPASERKMEEKLDMEDETGAAILNVKLKKVEETKEYDDEAGLVGKNVEEMKIETVTEGGKRSKLMEVVLNYYHTIRGFSASYWLVVALMTIFMTDLYTCTAFLTDYLYPFFFFLSNPEYNICV